MSLYKTAVENRPRALERMREAYARAYSGMNPPQLTDRQAALMLALSEVLTGPTSGGNAAYLAAHALSFDPSKGAPELAAVLKAAHLEYERTNPEPFTCPICGQHIKDGRPCGPHPL